MGHARIPDAPRWRLAALHAPYRKAIGEVIATWRTHRQAAPNLTDDASAPPLPRPRECGGREGEDSGEGRLVRA
jgi:hypothetical protein